jgi:hypothetical protein
MHSNGQTVPITAAGYFALELAEFALGINARKVIRDTEASDTKPLLCCGVPLDVVLPLFSHSGNSLVHHPAHQHAKRERQH